MFGGVLFVFCVMFVSAVPLVAFLAFRHYFGNVKKELEAPSNPLLASIPPGPPTQKFTDIFELLDSLQTFVGATHDRVMPFDGSKSLSVGFITVNEKGDLSGEWKIGMVDLGKSLDVWEAMPDERVDPSQLADPSKGPVQTSKSLRAHIVRQYITTEDGRIKIAMAVPGQREPDAYFGS